MEEESCSSNLKSLAEKDAVVSPVVDAVNGDSCVCDVNQSSNSSTGLGNGSEVEIQLSEKIDMVQGSPKIERFLPFLVGSPKLVMRFSCRFFD